MAFDAKLLRVPEIRWLGVFPSDADKYHLPDRCLLPLTPEGQITVFVITIFLRFFVRWHQKVQNYTNKRTDHSFVFPGSFLT